MTSPREKPPWPPETLQGLQEYLPALRAFLEAENQLIYPQTNEWEVLRFSWETMHCTIWQKKRGQLTYSPGATRALEAFSQSLTTKRRNLPEDHPYA